MNNKKRTIPYKEFTITIIITTILAFCLAFIVQLELLFRCEQKINFEELNLANLSHFYTIEQLNKLLEKNPKNTVAYIKIANIYKNLDEPAKANEYYKKALVVSQRSNFSLYSYAIFSANYGFLNLATSLAEEISGSNIKTYEFRARIYEAIADNLEKNENYEGANKAYQIAYKYAKNIKDAVLLHRIKEKYAISYTKLADEKILNQEIDEAIFDLKNSLKIHQTPIAIYKLGLIYSDIDSKTSERYLSKTLRLNPYLVNPYIYKKLIDKLYKQANLENNSSDINYYSNQIKKFEKKLKSAYLYKNDIAISNSTTVNKKEFLSKNSNYYLVFDVKNNTDYTIKKLYFNIQIIKDAKIYEIEKHLITPINPLVHYANPSKLNVELNDIKQVLKLNDLDKSANIYVKYYCKKAQNAPWTLISIQKINF